METTAIAASGRSRQYRIWLLIGLVFSFWLAMPRTLYTPIGPGLDSSWAIGIHMAVMQDLVFGKDICFTFGPLGVLATRLPLGISPWVYLAWDVLMGVSLVHIHVYLYRHVRFVLAPLAIPLVMLPLSEAYPHSMMLSSTLYLLFAFYLMHYLRHGRLWALCVASGIGVLAFYIKLNTGLPLLALLGATLGWLLFEPQHHSRRVIAVVSAATGGLLLGLAGLLHIALFAYIRISLDVINGYNDAMFLDLGRKAPLVRALVQFALFSGVAMAFLPKLWRDRRSLVVLILASAYMYLCFKHGFVRADGHVFLCLVTLPPAFALYVMFGHAKTIPWVRPILALSIIIGLYTVFHQFHRDDAWGLVENRVGQSVDYVGNIGGTPPDYRPAIREALPVPQRFLDRIGDATVDVLPFDISVVYGYDLAYCPRPMIQSYQAYDECLDRINEAHYLSPDGPRFLLFVAGDIDGRHPSFTESRTRLAMLTHYELVDAAEHFLLLERRATPLQTTETVTREGTVKMNEEISLEGLDDLQFLTAEVPYSLFGKVFRFLYHPATLRVTLRFADGSTADYRAITTVIRGGVLANRVMDDNGDAVEHFGTSGLSGRKVVGVTFHTDEGWGFKSSYAYSLSTVTVQPPAGGPTLQPVHLAVDAERTLLLAGVRGDGDQTQLELYWQIMPAPPASSAPAAPAAPAEDTGPRPPAIPSVVLLAGADAGEVVGGGATLTLEPGDGLWVDPQTWRQVLPLPAGLGPFLDHEAGSIRLQIGTQTDMTAQFTVVISRR